MKIFSRLLNEALDYIFPAFCAKCGQEGIYLCPTCGQKLLRLQQQRCLICQKPSPFGKTHTTCSKTKIDGIISALPYHDPAIKNLIEIFKYKFIDISELLGNFMVEAINNQELNNFFKDFIIIPVPLHKRRFRWRGFNQSQLLAQTLSSSLGIPIEDKIISRIRYTKPQVELKHDERKLNVKGAFEVVGDPTGKNFLLVDDVVTTGATINELAKLLKKKKAHSVWALTLAAD